jgi:predicted dehydrogenase
MDRMIRVAVIGAGHWGPNLIRNFHNHETSEVAWIVERDAARRKSLVGRYRDAKLSADMTDAISDESVDAVVVCTPTATHHEIARAALLAGKHVLVEKPVTTKSSDAVELQHLAESGGLVLMVGHVFLFNAAVRAVKQRLDAGELGRIYYISMVRTNLGPIRADVNAAWDLASHDISIANYWLQAEPVTVSAMGGSWINPGVEDAVFATMRYPEGVLVNLHVSWLNPLKAREITVSGERKMLTFDDMNLQEPVRIYDKGVSTEAKPLPALPVQDTFASFRASLREGDITIPRIAAGEPLKSECDHFLQCITTRKPPMSGAREGASVVRVLEALSRSVADQGREQRVE